MSEFRSIEASVSKNTLKVQVVSLGLGMLLAGCGQFQTRQPEVPAARIGADRVYAALPKESLTMSCDDAGHAVSDVDPAGMSGPWDAATIEDIRRRLDYQPR